MVGYEEGNVGDEMWDHEEQERQVSSMAGPPNQCYDVGMEGEGQRIEMSHSHTELTCAGYKSHRGKRGSEGWAGSREGNHCLDTD